MTISKNILAGSGAVEPAYEIEQSLVFERSSSAYLHRTTSSTSNQRTFTISTCVKRAGPTNATNDYDVIFGNYKNVSQSDSTHFELVFYQDHLQVLLWNTALLSTNRLFRDASAWYHIVLAVDSTSGTANNRVRLYVNGVEETSFATRNNPDQNFQFANNLSGTQQMVGNAYSGTNKMYDGQMAEFHHIDGTALTPSSFGETNDDTGQWIPKEYEGGSYGTNGFYGKFVSGAIGTDSSGQGNTMTVANLLNSDVVIDTPTNNFATLNPLYTGSNLTTFSEGNLKVVTPGTGHGPCVASIVPTSGKYYAEFICTAEYASGSALYGVKDVSLPATNADYLSVGSAKNLGYQGANGAIFGDGTTFFDTAPATFATNDRIGVAIDYDNSTIKWYKNNVHQYTKSSADLKDCTFALSDTYNGSSGATIEANFGQKAFAYTPPSGYTTLSTANLPDPAIPLPSENFNTVLWAGDGQTNRAITGVGHASDFVWVKSRTDGEWHNLYDKIRGVGKQLWSNSTSAETTYDSGEGLKVFGADGFTVGNSEIINRASRNFVGWSWKAGTVFSNDASVTGIGTNDSNGEVNATAGFSIVEYTGTGSDMTFAHGLSATPDLIIFKNRTSTANWFVYHSAIDANPNNYFINLNLTTARTNSGWIVVSSTTTRVFGFPNTNNNEYIAYHFVSIPGYSKFGQYVGNGNTNGPFVNCGFKPAFVIRKKVQGVGAWWINDIGRTPNNVSKTVLRANQSDAEVTSGDDSYSIDILSNGFKVRGVYGETNLNNNPFIYMAFAESPFKYANAR